MKYTKEQRLDIRTDYEKDVAMPIISVIVPIYNVEPYLPRCLDSLLGQTYRNLEILLIDDGSKDGSGAVCDAYAEKDARIRVVHKRNGGVSSARNKGLDLATGDYINFIDPDDYIEADMYVFLLSLLIENQADIAICAWDDYFENKMIPYKHKFISGIYSGKEALAIQFRNDFCSVCNMLFAKYITNGIRFHLEYINGEDRLFAVETLQKAKRVIYAMSSRTAKYHYCHRANSAGTKSFTLGDWKLLELCTNICNIFRKWGEKYTNIANRQKAMAYVQLLYMMNGGTNKYPIYELKIVNKMRKDIILVLKNPEITIKEKIRYTLLAYMRKFVFIMRKLKRIKISII